jgi:hypothetical protein
MAPAPSLSSRRCCRQGPLRTMSPPCPPSIASGSKHRRGGPSKHVNQSVVSSLHRTAEASVAVEGLRNTYIMSVAIAMSYPHRSAEANIAGGGPSKHVAAFPNRGPHSIAHSGSKRRQWRASVTHRSPHSIAHSGSKRRQWRASVTHRSPHSIAHSGSKHRQWRAY